LNGARVEAQRVATGAPRKQGMNAIRGETSRMTAYPSREDRRHDAKARFGQKINTQRGNNAQCHHVDDQSDRAAACHLKHLYGDKSEHAAADQRADLPDQRDAATTHTCWKEFGKERRLRRIAKDCDRP